MRATRAATEGTVAVGVATLLWGATGVLVKWTTMPGPVLTFWRVVFGIAILGLATFSLGQRPREGPIVPCLGVGVLFGLSIVLYFTAMRLTAIANVTLIGALTPVPVALLSSRTVGERVGLRKSVGIAAATLGVVVTVLSSRGLPGRSGVGDLAAVASLGLFVAYFLGSKRLRTKTPNTRYNFLVTAGALLPVSASIPMARGPLVGFPARDYFMVFLIALFPGSIGHWLVNWAHTRITASSSATIQLGVPVVAIAAAWVLVGERLHWVGVVGAVMCLAGILYVIRTELSQGDEARLEEASEAIA